MEKTKEQRQTSRERYLAQEAKAYEMLQADNLYDYIDGLRYTYSLCMRFKKNLKDFVWTKADLFKYTNTPLDKCLEVGILTPWKDTYYFNREKAESLQQYILENGIN